mmetsp:Transcript_14033/g.39991  ORF Transcript_14033/g.39991 Transcript_14033/m.39991 type:complete len:223 (-) Transcript_14033:64-732(-)
MTVASNSAIFLCFCSWYADARSQMKVPSVDGVGVDGDLLCLDLVGVLAFATYVSAEVRYRGTAFALIDAKFFRADAFPEVAGNVVDGLLDGAALGLSGIRDDTPSSLAGAVAVVPAVPMGDDASMRNSDPSSSRPFSLTRSPSSPSVPSLDGTSCCFSEAALLLSSSFSLMLPLPLLLPSAPPASSAVPTSWVTWWATSSTGCSSNSSKNAAIESSPSSPLS